MTGVEHRQGAEPMKAGNLLDTPPTRHSSSTTVGGGSSSSTSVKSDLVIVSAFGRGNWLAMDLANNGWKVTLIDVTDRLGPFEPADLEGPFGLFESSDVVPSQKNRFTEEGEVIPVRGGFTIWLPEGPLEFKSELTEFQMRHRGIPRELELYLRNQGADQRSHKETRRQARALLKKTFSENWLLHFAHQFSSNIHRESYLAAEVGNALPLFVHFSVHEVTASRLNKGLRNCQAAGVNVKTKCEIVGVQINKSSVEALEIVDHRREEDHVIENLSSNQGASKGAGPIAGSVAGQTSLRELETARAFAWMLTSEETQVLGATVSTTLYPRESLHSSWYWARYRVELRGRAFADQLPDHCVLISDPFLPWSHDNLLVLRRRLNKGSLALDVWVQLPSDIRGDQSYLEKRAREIEARIACKLPQSEPYVIEVPSAIVRWPVFDRSQLANLTTLKSTNFIFDGPEHWSGLDWLSAFRAQVVVRARLDKMKEKWEAAMRREAARSASQ